MRLPQRKSTLRRALPSALHRQQLRAVLRRGLEAECTALREHAGVSEEPSLREDLNKLSKAEWFYIIIHLVLGILCLPVVVLTAVGLFVVFISISAEAFRTVILLFSSLI